MEIASIGKSPSMIATYSKHLPTIMRLSVQDRGSHFPLYSSFCYIYKS